MNKIMELVLERRGYDARKLEEIESVEHSELAGMDEMVSCLRDVFEAEEKIVVLPDFDMDGIMSGVIGYAGLSELGFDVGLYIPNPADGYGFGPEQIDRLVSEHEGVRTIITCDTGIGCRVGAEYATGLGLRVLVTDHHGEEEDDSPRGIADAIVNPCAIGETYEHPGICGAHVLWQVLSRYASEYGTELQQRHVGALKVFAGIGTVSDVMPVLYENRPLVRESYELSREVGAATDTFKDGLVGATEAYKDAFRGLWAAYKVLSDNGKLSDVSSIDEQLYGYYLAPIFNAVKRMDGDMSKAFGVFTEKTPVANMKYLYELNEQRKQVVSDAMEQIEAQDNPFAPYCYIVDVMPGILGLLATRLSSDNGLPCVVVGKTRTGHFSGSGRAPDWLPLRSMAREKGFALKGHEGAFGCRFDDEGELERFCSFVDGLVDELSDGTVAEPPYDVVIADDGSGDFGIEPDAFKQFVDELGDYRPFGRGFEEPAFKMSIKDGGNAKWMTMSGGKHLKVSFGKSFEIICWGQGLLAGEDCRGLERASVYGKLSVNEFRGKRTAQMIGTMIPEQA